MTFATSNTTGATGGEETANLPYYHWVFVGFVLLKLKALFYEDNLTDNCVSSVVLRGILPIPKV
jgi:hypothetical protein